MLSVNPLMHEISEFADFLYVVEAVKQWNVCSSIFEENYFFLGKLRKTKNSHFLDASRKGVKTIFFKNIKMSKFLLLNNKHKTKKKTTKFFITFEIFAKYWIFQSF